MWQYRLPSAVTYTHQGRRVVNFGRIFAGRTSRTPDTGNRGEEETDKSQRAIVLFTIIESDINLQQPIKCYNTRKNKWHCFNSLIRKKRVFCQLSENFFLILFTLTAVRMYLS